MKATGRIEIKSWGYKHYSYEVYDEKGRNLFCANGPVKLTPFYQSTKRGMGVVSLVDDQGECIWLGFNLKVKFLEWRTK